LDDGFQHRQAARHVDLVIVTADDLSDRRLPFGRLREPVSALARAQAIVFDGFPPASMPPEIAGIVDQKPLYSLRRTLGEPVPLEPDRPWLSLGGPALALAGIAEPSRFQSSLMAAGWSITGLAAYGDHHRYTGRDLAAIAQKAHDAGVNAVVTTEKDAVR